MRVSDRKPAAVARGKRFADHEIVRAYATAHTEQEKAVVGAHGSFGGLVRSMTTTSGAAIVPTVWLGGVIDRARNLSAVMQAGAQVVPMDAKTVQIGRLTGDPTAGFRAEGSLVTASDPVFDNVTLDAKTMSALVVGSLEWFQDSDNVDAVVTHAIAQALSTQLDLMCLFGGLTTGAEVGATGFNTTFPTPPNPRGVLPALLALAPSSVLGSGANGTAQTALSYWNEIIDTIFTVRQFNEAPSGLIWSSKGAQQYAKAYDSTGQPIDGTVRLRQRPPCAQRQPVRGPSGRDLGRLGRHELVEGLPLTCRARRRQPHPRRPLASVLAGDGKGRQNRFDL